ncbi:phage tail protein, partial [Pseudomonas viridiflava]|uniref:phage tail protein n=1 Tax=Pseudomonas viridiflava TaxID=33069 RepID=UPI001F11B5C1
MSYRVRASQFGDGYKQQVGDGLNNKLDSYPVTFSGTQERVLSIMTFLDRHAGA